MEGLFNTQKGAPIVLIGPAGRERRRRSTIHLAVNDVLSFLLYGTTIRRSEGPRTSFLATNGPGALPLLYYSYHIMAGPGDVVPAADVCRRFPAVARQALHRALDAVAPPAQLPVALHRQHRWLDDRGDRPPALARLRPHAHREGYSTHVSAGNTLFTLLGFLGMYSVLSILWIVIVYRFIRTGPAAAAVAVPVANSETLTAV